MKKSLLIISFLFAFIVANSQIPCVVIQWNTERTAYSVVNYNYNPISLPITGLSSDFEVLVKRTPYAMPEYDTRLKVLVTTYAPSETYDATYTTNRMWVETFGLLDRSNSEQMTSVDEAENYANFQVFPSEKQIKYIVLTLSILDRKASGLTVSAKQQAILDRVNAKALRIWTNHILGETKKDSLNAGNLVDLDYGWENIDPEVE